MNTSMLSTLSGLRSAQQKMDLIGNNVANLQTDGFKSAELNFGSILASQLDTLPKEDTVGTRLTPQQLNLGQGALPQLQRINFAPGPLKETGIPTDFAIQGNGFFQVERDGQPFYTRMGAFRLAMDGTGRMLLTTSLGDPVLDSNEEPIELPPGYNMEVRESGEILFVNQTNPRDVIAGPTMAVYQVANRQLLVERGEGLYELPAGAPAAELVTGNEEIQVKQGVLEGSNVDITKEMLELMEIQRTYQLNARALSYVDQMGNIINNIYGR